MTRDSSRRGAEDVGRMRVFFLDRINRIIRINRIVSRRDVEDVGRMRVFF